MTPRAVVGRNAEIGAVDSFLDKLEGGPAALVFDGLPGIGKTTLWQQVFARASGRSLAVLSCRPAELEAKLAFASLADLFEPVADEILPRLPEPQRLALAVALMRASPQGPPPRARAVAAAVLSALRLLAAASPVVLAVDDQQWLDRPSAEALAFALRRIGALRIGIIATARVEDGVARDPLALDGAFAGSIERIRIGPLNLSALHHVIRSHLDHVFPRPTLRRIGDTSGGNPFFALELARALMDADREASAGEPLPVPDELSSLVLRRLDRLPAHARATLLVVSALSAPTVELLRRVVGDVDADTAIAQGERAQLLEVREDCVFFAHPLLASAVYASAAAGKRREVHRRLAEVIAAPEERARHLALGASQLDADVARALDDASLLARQRGAPDAAGDLLERAARLTPAADAAAIRRRRTEAAEHYFHAGDRAHAHTLLDEVLADRPSGAERAAVLHLLGQIRAQEDSFADAIHYLEEALTHAGDAAASVPIRLDLAYSSFNAGDVSRAVALASEALVGAERLGDSGLIACALSAVVVGEVILGRNASRASMERALALEDRHRRQTLMRPRMHAALMAIFEGRIDDAAALLREMCSWATERGEESDLPFLLCNLSWVEWWGGDPTAALAHAEEAHGLAVQSGSETMRAFSFAHRSRAHAVRGDVSAARADLAEGRDLIERTGYAQGLAWLLSSQAMLELSLGEREAAAEALAPLVLLVEAIGAAEPFVAALIPDALEGLLVKGQRERAQSLLDVFARRAQDLDRPWMTASAARASSLLAAERGDLEAAVAAAEDAVARWRQLEIPIEHGRALITLGQMRRRRGERRAAREVLERATVLFRDVGAPLWEERAADELRRIPSRRPVSTDRLTPTEEQVAMLAASGRTNREVARTLHMSPKTVEANLARIYGKLGIRSRAELGGRMATIQSKK